jgi:hypothetical protein
VIDPRPLPPQAAIVGLPAGGAPVTDFRQLTALPKSDRAHVVKPSDSQRWLGVRAGVKIADDLTREEWTATIDTALADFDRTPWILQSFIKAKRVRRKQATSIANATIRRA